MKMTLHKTLLASATVMSISGLTAADTNRFEDTLDVNVGQWTFLSGPQRLIDVDCNVDPYLRSDNENWTVYIMPIANDSPFRGNFRAAGVSGFGLDLRLNWLGVAFLPRELTLEILFHDKHGQHPGSQYVGYYIGDDVPFPGEGWKSFDFDIPSGADETPEGWVLVNYHDTDTPPSITWPELMENVQYIRLMFGRPDYMYGFNTWDVSIATPWIESENCAVGDLNCDGVVDVSDLLLLLSNWGACANPSSCAADLNGDGVVDVTDLLMLLAAWG